MILRYPQRMRTHSTDGRLAIRHGDVLLSVPPMHPNTPRDVRVRVLEYVLRRQPGLAMTLAEVTSDLIERRHATLGRLASLMEQTPHKNARGLGMAA